MRKSAVIQYLISTSYSIYDHFLCMDEFVLGGAIRPSQIPSCAVAYLRSERFGSKNMINIASLPKVESDQQFSAVLRIPFHHECRRLPADMLYHHASVA